ncbi:SDR family oxidoreductase [Streptomyces sp. cg40]|uniref:SDR family oxidoreductase n=1 Tax=Streptomyces sp. cg40 TaxID=3419764 RepID=UPI003CFE3076
MPPEIVDTVAAMTSVRRAGTLDGLAAACAFLCSDQAGFITGQQIGVNGGWYM